LIFNSSFGLFPEKGMSARNMPSGAPGSGPVSAVIQHIFDAQVLLESWYRIQDMQNQNLLCLSFHLPASSRTLQATTRASLLLVMTSSLALHYQPLCDLGVIHKRAGLFHSSSQATFFPNHQLMLL